ncbi:glycosyltransferase [Vreelandella nanhaiensis]|uniref:Glycosyltransferase family 1 protein n=1 Tax=Vreelandella nanhaiensis TaxID=1258546 RepID=A0A433KJT5_9GAMM|nr:glycosyltransferase [Halomonas nanhaiensis]RUR29986.1 glycosyltransferase family 1 protein [Halomonas nanhaiensis]
MRSEAQWVVLSDGGRPTEDIYFLESAAPVLRQQGATVNREVASHSLGAAFMHGRSFLRRYQEANLLLCRSLPLGWLRWLERNRNAFGYIAYLIDDDIAAAALDTTLPGAYRKRMAGIASLQPRLLALADEVVTCSDQLASYFTPRHPNVSVLTPPLLAPLPGHEHFAAFPSTQSPWQIGFHGTRAHLQDLLHIAPSLEALQQQRSDTELEIMLGQHTPKRLATLPRVKSPAPLPWQAFQQYQRLHRLHIGLAPLLATPFNQGKSFIKFLDIAAMGGVGIYSNRYPYTEVVRHGENGLLVGDSLEEWQAGLNRLLNNPEATAKMASQAARDALNVGNPQKAITFWQSRQAKDF